MHRFHAGEGVEPIGGGHLEVQAQGEVVHHRFPERRGEAHRADALHVAVAAQRQEAGAFAPHHATQERQVDERLHVAHPVCVMSNAHRPGKHRVVRTRVLVRHLLHLPL